MYDEFGPLGSKFKVGDIVVARCELRTTGFTAIMIPRGTEGIVEEAEFSPDKGWRIQVSFEFSDNATITHITNEMSVIVV